VDVERLAAFIANPEPSVLLVLCEREEKGPPGEACPVGPREEMAFGTLFCTPYWTTFELR